MILSKFVWKNPNLSLSEKKEALEAILKDAEEILKETPILTGFVDAVKEEHDKIVIAMRKLN